jgi:hypothetical protein
MGKSISVSSSYITERRNVDTENIFPILPLVKEKERRGGDCAPHSAGVFLRFGFTIIGYLLVYLTSQQQQQRNETFDKTSI